jgi:hypothetical protein
MFAREPPHDAAGAAGAAVAADAAGPAGTRASFTPSMRASSVPTGTVVPSATRISRSTPA